MVVAARLGAFEERDFRLLWLGQATSAFGSSLVPVALAFAVIDLTGSKTSLGAVLSVGLVSRVVLLLVGGVVADRMPRQRVMLAADALRATTQGLVAVLLLSGHARVWHLLVLFALFGAGDAFFSPASTGLVPQTVSGERLQQANALMSLSRSVSWAAGPAIAGTIVAVAGPGLAFAIDSATFLVSSASLALLRLSWPLDVPRASFGTCGGVGSLLGDAIALRVRPGRPLFAGFLAVSLWALEPALLARPFGMAAIAVAAAAGFGAISFSNTLWFTALQERIQPQAISRVSSYDWLGSLVCQPAGYAVAGPAAALFGTPATLLRLPRGVAK